MCRTHPACGSEAVPLGDSHRLSGTQPYRELLNGRAEIQAVILVELTVLDIPLHQFHQTYSNLNLSRPPFPRRFPPSEVAPSMRDGSCAWALRWALRRLRRHPRPWRQGTELIASGHGQLVFVDQRLVKQCKAARTPQ